MLVVEHLEDRSLPNLFCFGLESFDSYFDIWKIFIYIRFFLDKGTKF
jgi:hypothetical protein